MVNSAIARKILKVKALAEHGIAGEKRNARRMLNDLLDRYNVTLAELEHHEEEKCFFDYNSKIELCLISQIIGMIIADPTRTYKNATQCGKQGLAVNLTFDHKVEIETLYNLYRLQWKKEVMRLYQAFIHKHNLFSSRQLDDARQGSTQGHNFEDVVEGEKIRHIMRGIDSLARPGMSQLDFDID